MVASDRQACNLEIGITNFCGELRYVDAGNERGHVTTRRVGGCWGGPRVGAIVRVEDVFETVAIVLEVGEECVNVEVRVVRELVIGAGAEPITLAIVQVRSEERRVGKEGR